MAKRKFVLVEPKSMHLHVYSRYTIPRLGVILLGTMLRDRGWDVRVYIEDVSPVDMKEVLSADVVGISTLTSTAPQSYRLAEEVRSHGIPVVMGGTHVSFCADEALDFSDYVVRGEGEEALFELLDAMDGNVPYEKILGLSYWRGGKKAHNPERPLKEDLDSNPIPDYSLVEGWHSNAIISIATSRGCPFTCTFCSVPGMYGHGFRMHSVERVLEEIRINKPQYIFFADDLFTANRKRTKDLLRRMIAEGLTPQWGAQVRIETAFDPELLALMKESNCFNVFVGFESINPKTLDLFNKRQTYEKIVTSIQKFKETGIRIHGMFVVGSDADDKETIYETSKFAQKWELETIQLMILTPLPGSPDYDQFYATGDRELLSNDWSLYDGHHAVYRPKNMTAYELNVAAIDAMEKFYSWKTILKSLWKKDWISAIIQTSSKNLLRDWKKQNGAYIIGLRDQVFGAAKEVSSLREEGLVYRIGVPKFILDKDIGKSLTGFLTELGISVVPFGQSGGNAGSSFSGKIDWLKGKVDCIVMPVMERANKGEEEVFEQIQRLRKALPIQKDNLPAVVQLFLDRQDGSLYSSMAQIAAIFTRDLDKVHKAYRSIMPSLSAREFVSVPVESKPVILRV
ncbi:MAG: B12-binding domain-containing radical SAM protein [Leptospirales bacterium]